MEFGQKDKNIIKNINNKLKEYYQQVSDQISNKTIYI